MRPAPLRFLLLLPLAVLLLAPPANAGEMRPVEIRDAIQHQAVALGGPGTDCPLLEGFSRQVVAGDVVHYSMRLRTGPGEYDQIGIHRVVRERRPYIPIRTEKNIFLQHGDCKNFTGMFLPGTLSPAMPDDFGFAVFLARHDVDVWGIDQNWCLVPKEETEFGFMANWGLGRAIRDLRTGILVARAVRLLTGSGCDPMILSGYSSGVWSAVGLLDQETQLPARLRQVGAYIPVDAPIKSDDEQIRELEAADLAYQRELYQAGQYESPIFFEPMGTLARDYPDEESPFAPGFTNLGFMLFLTAYPGAAWPAPFHYWAGVLGEDGMPTDLRLTALDAAFDFLVSAIPYQPIQWFIDCDIFCADLEELPYDDHLGEITVPVLSVGSVGGFDGLMEYGTYLLGSTDVTFLYPSVGPPVETDLAHIDLFTAPESEDLFWAPALEWIEAHAASIHRLAGAEFLTPAGALPLMSDAAAAVGLALEGVSPNPAREAATLSFALPQSAPARLDLIDITGRLVRSRELGVIGSGWHQETMGDLSGVAPGVYFVRLSQGAEERTQRIVVVH